MRQTSFDGIRPCPCGGNPEPERRDGLFFVICKKCGTKGEVYETEIQAVRSWNKKTKRKGAES